MTKKRAKTRCLWCRERIIPKARGRTPRYCSASCRQRAYEARKLKVVHDAYKMDPLQRLRQDLAFVTLEGLVGRILTKHGLAPPEPPAPKRRRPHLKVVQDEVD